MRVLVTVMGMTMVMVIRGGGIIWMVTVLGMIIMMMRMMVRVCGRMFGVVIVIMIIPVPGRGRDRGQGRQRGDEIDRIAGIAVNQTGQTNEI